MLNDKIMKKLKNIHPAKMIQDEFLYLLKLVLINSLKPLLSKRYTKHFNLSYAIYPENN